MDYAMLNQNENIGPWDIASMNMSILSQYKFETAILPVGSLEPHNRHLPYGQDLFHTNWIARQSCKVAWQNCNSIACLPPVPYGVDCNLMDFPMTIHVSQTILDGLLKDIILSMRRHGIRKFVIINGHGGNEFIPFVRQIQSDCDVYVFLCDWWKVGFDIYKEIFKCSDDHAGEMETSIALALYPKLVNMKAAKNSPVRQFRFEALQKGWIRTSRNFSKINDDCAAGNPFDASAEKGKKYLDIVVNRISSFLLDLSKSEIDEYFPFST